MFTDRHHHHPEHVGLPPCGQREPTRALAFSLHHNAAETLHYLTLDRRALTVFVPPAPSDRSLPLCDGHVPTIANHRAIHSMPIEANACGAV
jgi:hypothetical protein